MSDDRTALITGASAGIGAAFAKVFAKQGYHVVLVARREDKLTAVADSIRDTFDVKVTLIPMDLARADACQAIATRLEGENIHVDALVNNAGYALRGGFLDSPWTDQAAMLQVMLNGYTELTHGLLPGMIERGYGRIINVSSLAAFAPPMAGSLYSAIKRYVNDFSAAIDFEFRDQGIHCTAVCPGFTYSEFHDVMDVREQTDRIPKFMWQTAETVAAQGYESVERGQVIRINGVFNRIIAAIMGILPMALLLRMGRSAPTLSD